MGTQKSVGQVMMKWKKQQKHAYILSIYVKLQANKIGCDGHSANGLFTSKFRFFFQTHTNKCNWVFSLPDHPHRNHASDVSTQFIREDERSHFFN